MTPSLEPCVGCSEIKILRQRRIPLPGSFDVVQKLKTVLGGEASKERKGENRVERPREPGPTQWCPMALGRAELDGKAVG